MRKLAWVTAMVLPAMGAAVAVVALRSPRAWTSSSPEAIAALVRGRAADMKLYKNEARGHYEEAVRLDPGFVAAKLLLAVSLPAAEQERSAKLLAEVRAADLSRLTASERFLVSYALARLDRKPADATKVIDAHLRQHPDDSYALYSKCTEAWLQPDWDEAERCNRRLLAVDPNWVLSYNYLGYIAMARGRFQEAEKDFLAYKYLAPDQANPHDSLGELYTVLGRYDDATRELEEAVRLRPDFCASYQHLLLVAFLARDATLADSVVARAGGGRCSDKELAGLRCSFAIWRPYVRGELAAVLAAARTGCLEKSGDLPLLVHRAAVLAGDLATAETIETALRTASTKDGPAPAIPGGSLLEAALEHMEGLRQLAAGRAGEAVALLERADAKLAFRGDGQGIFKLINQLSLAEALRATGALEDAGQVLAAVRAVNPHIEGLFGSQRGLAPAGPR